MSSVSPTTVVLPGVEVWETSSSLLPPQPFPPGRDVQEIPEGWFEGAELRVVVWVPVGGEPVEIGPAAAAR
jgi:hypothetical protein